MKQKKNKGRTQIGSLATEDQGQMKMDRGTPWTKANVLMTRKRTLNTSIAFLRDTRTEYCKKKWLKQPLNKLDTLRSINLGKGQINDSFLPGHPWMYDQSLLLTKQGTFAFPAVLSSAGDTGCLSASTSAMPSSPRMTTSPCHHHLRNPHLLATALVLHLP